MNKDKQPTTRREALKNIFRSTGYLGIGGTFLGTIASGLAAPKLELRPPGALNENDFLKSCLKCGACVEACPYDSLILNNSTEDGTLGLPYLKPRIIPCYMCTDIPCVPVCPSGALDIKSLQNDDGVMDINKSKMGVAIIHKETCIAYWGIQCDACYRACPLIDEAISLVYEKNERTGKHAFLKPVVHSDFCTGCGKCEHACITEKAAIMVLPVDAATGKVGDHYIKGWDKSDESRINEIKDSKSRINKQGEPDKYLNDWESLIED